MEVFYRLNPKRVQRYQPYMVEWLKQHKEEQSEVGWMNGMYVQRAVGTMLSKKAKYPDKPLKVYGDPEPQTEEEAEAQAFSDAERFAAFAMVFNKNHKAKQPEAEPDVDAPEL